ncbi:hypothetical protein EV379_0813 [Microterricola gilva]|uniref:Uncharacterized protein n=1 Tax=Microterricola gilva TaxID=393267 RepID=A0A4V2GAJ8_9MICO|nr:hypothetical protein EV379_0813 [Microterricola gilva]
MSGLRGRPRSSAAPSSQRDAQRRERRQPNPRQPQEPQAMLVRSRCRLGAAGVRPRFRYGRGRPTQPAGVSRGVRASGAASFLGCSLEPARRAASRKAAAKPQATSGTASDAGAVSESPRCGLGFDRAVDGLLNQRGFHAVSGLRGRPRSSAAPSSQRDAQRRERRQPNPRQSQEPQAMLVPSRCRLGAASVSIRLRALGAASFLGCSLEPARRAASRKAAAQPQAVSGTASAAGAVSESPRCGLGFDTAWGAFVHAGLSERRSDEGAATHAKP